MKRMLKPADILSLAFAAGLAALTFVYTARIPDWEGVLMRYAGIAAAIVGLAALSSRSGSPAVVRVLHAFSPVPVVLLFFDSLADLIPGIRPHYFDQALIEIDLALFGVHPTVWIERFIDPVLTAALQIAYICYYPMAIVLGATLYARGKGEQFDRAVFGLLLCFYLSYVGYLLVPAVGPRFTLHDMQRSGLEANSMVVAIQETLNSLERNKTDAFPSGHTAVAVLTLYYAWKTRERILAALLAPVVVGLIVSTVYLRYHYAIDVAAGLILAAGTIGAAPWLYRLVKTQPDRQGEARTGGSR